MTDEIWLVHEEGTGAKNVVRMDVAQQDVADWFCGGGANGGAEGLAVGEAAAWVGDQNGVAADDEADVGDGVVIGRAGVLIDAAADVDAGGDFLKDDRRVGAQSAGQAAEAEPYGESSAAGQHAANLARARFAG